MNDPIEHITSRLERLHPRLIDLSLDRLRNLLSRLDHPEKRLPPVIHVAGTNGKGSTCAFIRAMAEAAGLSVHVYTSPHLIRFNERIRVAGSLVPEHHLVDEIERIEAINGTAPITVFEVITATAFNLFAKTPADLCVLEVGLGGRGDATNVVPLPAACAITSISLDHRELLGPSVDIIAREKAGIIKPGRPVAIGVQTDEVRLILLAQAAALGAPVHLRGRDWHLLPSHVGFCYRDGAGSVKIPVPSLPGLYQQDNAGIAVAALRAAGVRHCPSGVASAEWPARLQRLHGRLASLLPSSWELWLDGGHNPGAGAALAEHLGSWQDRPVHIIVGMKQTKDSIEFLYHLLPLASTIWAVCEAKQHAAMPVEVIVAASGGIARRGPTARDALTLIGQTATRARVLICGSLYLAGEILKQD